MVVFGERGCIRVKLMYSGKVVVFGLKDCILAKVVVFQQSGCIGAKLLYSGKVFQSGKMVVFGQKLL